MTNAKTTLRRTAAALAGAIGLSLPGCGPTVQQASTTAGEPANVLGHTLPLLDGTPHDLSQYAGQVVLIVNTASKCGFTPQYESLQALYQAKQDQGLVILGFPSNDFMGQEPGSNDEIAQFCQANYGVTFPMFEKIAVKGDDAHPLFRDLAAAAGEPGWNFNKYLIDREGRVVARFAARVAPDSDELTSRVDELLAQPAG